MSHYDLECDWGMEEEARLDEVREADLETLELAALARQARQDAKRGICWHSARLGKVEPAVYAVQDFMDRGTEICRDCGAVLPADWPWGEEGASRRGVNQVEGLTR